MEDILSWPQYSLGVVVPKRELGGWPRAVIRPRFVAVLVDRLFFKPTSSSMIYHCSYVA